MIKTLRIISCIFIINIPGLLVIATDIDSLNNVLYKATDKAKPAILNNIAEYYLHRDLEQSLEYAQKAFDFSTRYKNKHELANSLSNLGKIYYIKDEYKRAIDYFNQSLQYNNVLKRKKEIADNEYYLGKLYMLIGIYDNSLKNFQNALKTYIDQNNKLYMAKSYQNIGQVYYNLGNYELALEYYNISLDINNNIQNREDIALIYQDMGVLFYKQNESNHAIEFYLKSLSLFKELNNKEGIASSYSNIGLIYENKGRFEKSLKYYQQALANFQEIDYKRGVIVAMHNLGSVYKNLGNYKSSLDYYSQSLKLSQELALNDNIIMNYHSLSNLYQLLGNYKHSLDYFRKYISLKDSLLSIENQKRIAELETKFNLEIKEKELERTNAELKLRSILLYSVIGVFILLLVLMVLLFKAYSQKHKAKKELEIHKNNLEELVKKRTAELKLEISERKIAEESDRLKTAFLANMSHEIRTPMNSIIAFSNFLKDRKLTEKQRKEYIGYIIKCGNSLLRLIDDIIDTAKIEAKQIEISKSTCNISLLLQEVFNHHKERKKFISKDHIDFFLESDKKGVEYIIQTDPIRLKQILDNLIVNAFKYTEAGGIFLGYSNKNNYIEFYVMDTGIGIPTNKQKLIFDRFGQADDSLSRQHGGTGLGLAISKNLVELMGGKMWLRSKVNEGSTFFFTIPYSHIEIKSSKITEEAPVEDVDINNYSWNKKKILIVEDEDLNYKVLEIALKPTKINILRATDGLKAIEYCKNDNSINIVLMDIQMPKMNGYDATKQIKAIRSSLPVIAQTSFAQQGDAEKCFNAGCDDYLPKPIKFNDLLSKIDKFLS